VIVVVVIVLMVVQMVSNDAYFFRKGFFHYGRLSLAAGDATYIRGIHSEALSHAIIDAPKK
jgi:hypothetical protein